MPTYVENVLIVTGDKDALLAFREENASKQTTLDFGKAVPMPSDWNDVQRGEKSAPRMEEKYGEEWWLPWSRKHWGTKWNACDPNVSLCDDANVLQYSFETAWAAPAPWVVSVASKYPALRFEFKYGESGCFYSGYMQFEHGVKVSHEGGAYDRFFHDASEDYDDPHTYESQTAWYGRMERLLNGTPPLAAWLEARDPDTYWTLMMRGAFGEPTVTEQLFYDGLRTVTIEETEAEKRRLQGEKRINLQRAAALLEEMAPRITEYQYKEMYGVLKELFDCQ
jgi:hypothetical protein